MRINLTANCLFFAYLAVATCAISANADVCRAQVSNIVEKFVFRGKSQAVVRKGLVAQLELVISKLDAVYSLTDIQIAKIRLAGEVDIARFLRECEQVGEVERIRFELNREYHMQVMEILTPLRQRIGAGFFFEISLFAKTLYSVLTPEQVEMAPRLNLLNHSLALRELILKRPQIAPTEQAQRERLMEMMSAQENFRRDAQRRP